MIRLRYLHETHLITVGKSTGTPYDFPGAGSEADVDENDAEYLLSKEQVSCCSGLRSRYFEVVSEVN